ncbi:MAG: DUF3850 domain-containing protein [Sphaerochaetaceae bacterium]
MQHELKIYPSLFRAIADGRKNFEIMSNDNREFQAGDTVILNECLPSGLSTFRKEIRRITYVTNYNQQPGWVVFGMERIEHNKKE